MGKGGEKGEGREREKEKEKRGRGSLRDELLLGRECHREHVVRVRWVVVLDEMFCNPPRRS
eukprot:913990-Rhodomonas_salina.2